MRDSWRHFVAEFIGTFALVFVGGAAIMIAKDSATPTGLVEIALAHGLILAVMVSALMRISGHFNPAVTIGFLATRRIEPMVVSIGKTDFQTVSPLLAILTAIRSPRSL